MIPAKFSTKSASKPSRSNPLSGFFDFLGTQGFGQLQASLAVRYYSSAAPVASGIDKIAEPFAEIEPVVWDKVKKEYVDHEVLKLLQNPNPEDSTESFQMKLAAWLLINGEVFPVATGGINRKPLELFAFPSADVSLEGDSQGFLGKMQFGSLQDQQIYSRADNTIGGRFRYYNKFQDSEAWQIKNFNPKAGLLRGASKLQGVMAEVEQYIESSTHNLSLLVRGARPSGVFTAEGALSDEQFESLKEQIDNWFSGSSNAGRPILIDGAEGLDYKEVSTSNRDMDFLKLKENVTESIYTRLDVPLAMISTKSMTLDNLKVSKLALYDDAVVPLANRIYGELTQMLMPRYKNSENLEITFNPTQIPALESRRVENIKLRKEIAVNTPNEMRVFLGDDTVSDEGADLLPQPKAQTVQLADEKARFAADLRKQTDSEGKASFTELEIKDFCDSYL